MKAAIINSFGSPDVFRITNSMPEPTIGSNEILIKVLATSINPVDWKHRLGNHKYILGSKFPIVLGYDVAGIVKQTGNDVTSIRVNDYVFGRLDKKYGGALATYAVGTENCCIKINETIPAEEAAAYPLASITALQALRNKGNIKEGHQVLITGATGGVGHFAIQIAKIYKSTVTAICGNGHDKILKKLNPDHLIRYTEHGYKTKLSRYDIIFDAAGKESYLRMHRHLKKGGVFISILPRPKIIAHRFIAAFRKHKVKTLLMAPNKDDLNTIHNWIVNGNLFVNIDKKFPLEEIASAHRFSAQGHTEGKVIVTLV